MNWKKMAGIFAISLVVNLITNYMLINAVDFPFGYIKGDFLTRLPQFILLLPVILLQPWYLLEPCYLTLDFQLSSFFGYGIWTFIISVSIITSFITAVVYSRFDQCWLNKVWHRVGSWRLPCAIGILALLAAPFSYLRSIDYPPRYHQPPSVIAGFGLSGLKDQYFFDNSSGLCDEWLWRGTVDRKGLHQMCKALQLSVDSVPGVYNQLYDTSSDNPFMPYWWKPVQGTDMEAYYRTDSFDGINRCRSICLLWDRQTGIFYAKVIQYFI